MSNQCANVSFPGGKRVTANIGEFEIITDQSIANGGAASAPEPFDLFIASIASCAGIFALGFCQSRDISTNGMNLSMSCERYEKKKQISRMTLHLTLPPNFPEKYRAGITRSMEQCTVKKHMLDPPEFVIEAD